MINTTPTMEQRMALELVLTQLLETKDINQGIADVWDVLLSSVRGSRHQEVRK